jgi:hypothetical protein
MFIGGLSWQTSPGMFVHLFCLRIDFHKAGYICFNPNGVKHKSSEAFYALSGVGKLKSPLMKAKFERKNLCAINI